MLSDASSVGLMEGCFFVPRSELINWLREDFNLDITKVEQCASGAVYLQVMDRLFAGKVMMSKVNWGAKYNYDFLKNYKLLQEVFDKCQVKKHIEIEKLTRAKYQDNLEFLQWLKCLYDRNNGGGRQYNALERRCLGQGYSISGVAGLEWLKAISTKSNCVNRIKAASTVPQSGQHTDENNERQTDEDISTRGKGSWTSINVSSAEKGIAKLPKTNSTSVMASSPSATSSEATMKALKAQIRDLQDDLEAARSESKFYFKKLRDLEIICGQPECKSLTVEQIEKILYAEGEGEDEGSESGNKSTQAKQSVTATTSHGGETAVPVV